MRTVKSCTDLSQSKKLAEILPFDTADMHYNNLSVRGVNYVDSHHADLMPYMDAVKTLSGYSIVNPLFEVIPCWSLAALLNVLPDELGDNHFLTLNKEGAEYCCCYEDINGNSFRHEFGDNPIDACYEMILKLHELKML